MASHTGKITKRVVDSWKYKREYPIQWGGELKGFGLKANANGAKSYIINYRNKYNRTCRYSIGKHGGKLTANQVRKAFASIRDGKTACTVKTKPRGRANVKGGEGEARMAIRVLRAIF